MFKPNIKFNISTQPNVHVQHIIYQCSYCNFSHISLCIFDTTTVTCIL